MKKMLMRMLPFAAVLAIALASVVVSCTSVSHRNKGLDTLSVNLGVDDRGRLFTVQVFDRIARVMVIDRSAPARRNELVMDTWHYDARTTELVVPGPLPSDDVVIHVEGAAARPHRFVLGNGGVEDLFVVVDGRLAIQDYDYEWSADGTTLRFRRDLDMTKVPYMIRYRTLNGSGSFGTWSPEGRDQLAYLEARHRAEQVAAELDHADGLFFLEPAASGEIAPTIVRRRPTAAERRCIEAAGAVVFKSRYGVDDEVLSREVGFDVRTPDEVVVGPSVVRSMGKMIGESAFAGELASAVREFYEVTSERPGDGSAGTHGDHTTMTTLSLTMRTMGTHLFDCEPAVVDPRLVISRTTVDAGLPVERVVQWGTQTSGDFDVEPEVIRHVTYEWTHDGVMFRLEGHADDRAAAEALVRRLIAER